MSSKLIEFLEKSKDGNEKIFLPVLNIPRADFPLRTEITYTFARFGINLKDLVFTDEFDMTALKTKGELAVTLVDHNLLARHQQGLISVLVEVIDHHKDELAPHVKKTIEPVGSCSTLIAEKILSNKPDLLDNQVTGLLLSAILLDSVNLDPRAGRMTPKDQHIVQALQDKVKFNLEELYHSVNEAKFDVSGLTSAEILRKDYKAVPLYPGNPARVGISSIGLPLQGFLKREGISQCLLQFCTSKGINTLVVMAMYFESRDGPPLRQVYVCGPDETSASKLARFLRDNDQLKLNAIKIDLPEGFCFDQMNIKASRKVVFPLVMNFLKVAV
ncbi:exopolyphosphatase PRUNE1 isoform X2 [Nematostella vectensis]|uniref:exopolyphosphatase PRUNE1 isoform X2 n=1 Tax=Nematostella vectensis TaxID=45351 RepID=UPI0020771838|nr:exopolyphosphatase PRUNE1 isoform X2 [Nematostella vectensis]